MSACEHEKTFFCSGSCWVECFSLVWACKHVNMNNTACTHTPQSCRKGHPKVAQCHPPAFTDFGALRTLGHRRLWGIADFGASRTLGHRGLWGVADFGASRTLGRRGLWGITDFGASRTLGVHEQSTPAEKQTIVHKNHRFTPQTGTLDPTRSCAQKKVFSCSQAHTTN